MIWNMSVGVQSILNSSTYIFPPSSLICRVTTASPIQTIENTPEKTRSVCSLLARSDKNKLRSRQKISGPLVVLLAFMASCQTLRNIPQIPIPQAFTQPSLQESFCIWPPAHKSSDISTKALNRSPTFEVTWAASLSLEHSAQQIFRPQYLPHLLPHSE